MTNEKKTSELKAGHKLKREWSQPNIKSLDVKMTRGGEFIGDFEDGTYQAESQ